MSKPHFGYTRHHGFAVHARTADHLQPAEGDNGYARFNKRVALWLTKNVGSMTAFWLFTLASMTVAPSCLFAAGYIHWKSFLTTFGFELLATLILSTWLELALMPAIMVGQNLQNAASDARAAKQFEDLEQVKDWLDLRTQGGLSAVLAAVNALAAGAQVSGGAGSNPAAAGLPADQRVVPPPAAMGQVSVPPQVLDAIRDAPPHGGAP